MSGSGISKIDVLTRENFDTWKIQMEALLIKCDLWDYVNGDLGRPQGEAATAAWVKNDLKAKAEIILAISPSEIKQIKNCATSRDVWLKLESIYHSKRPARKVALLTQLAVSRMNEGADVREHMNAFFDAVDKLADMDVDINKDLLSVLLLHSLPASFDNFRSALKSRDLPEPEVLRVEILKKSESRGKLESDVATSLRPARRHEDDMDFKIVRTTSKTKCYRCGKLGHKAVQCSSMKHKQRGGEDDDVTETVEACFDSLEASIVSDRWCLDSGGTSQQDSRFFPRSRRSDSSTLNAGMQDSGGLGSSGAGLFDTEPDSP